MTTDDNPFAAPSHEPLSQTPVEVTGNIRVDGKRIIIGNGEELPHRCVKCNAPCDNNGKRYTNKLSYFNPLWYLTLFVHILVTFILYFIFRKSVKLSYSYCPVHYRRRFFSGLIALLFPIGGMGISVAATAYQQEILFAVSGVLFLTGLISLIYYNTTILRVSRHKSGSFWISGTGKAFRLAINDSD